MLASTLLFSTLVAQRANAAFYYPDIQTSLLEHILVDNWGAYASNFSSAITPCTRYVTQTGSAALNSGRTTAAQWMRVLFHDVITANVSARTGGIDASIGFETMRGENSGSAFNDSFTFWKPWVTEHVSMADLLALGTAMSNNLCGGTNLPYRAGRIDATAAGITTGVPAPETSLDETLEQFSRAGFSTVDAIAFTACGHTLGSVHHGGFPTVVSNASVTSTNTNGGSNFDSTRGIFDPNVVDEYLSSTGQKGGPLVTSFNQTSRSDLRLYEADGNATMKALLAQGEGFLDTCVALFQRAMNTVPAGVQLGADITAIDVKPINVTFDFTTSGQLSLSGKIRVLSPAGSAPPASLTFRLPDHNTHLLPENATGQSVFGRSGAEYATTTYFPFISTRASIRNALTFGITGDVAQKHSFPISSDTFVVPSLTSLSGTTLSFTIAIAAGRSCNDLTVDIVAPLTQPGTLAPRTSKKSVAADKQAEGLDGFTFCRASAVLEDVPTGLVSVKVLVQGSVVDTLLVDGGHAGW